MGCMSLPSLLFSSPSSRSSDELWSSSASSSRPWTLLTYFWSTKTTDLVFDKTPGFAFLVSRIGHHNIHLNLILIICNVFNSRFTQLSMLRWSITCTSTKAGMDAAELFGGVREVVQICCSQLDHGHALNSFGVLALTRGEGNMLTCATLWMPRSIL